MRHVGVLVGDVRDLVVAEVRVQDALRAEHAQAHVQVARIGTKQRRELVHVTTCLKHLFKHPAQVEDRNHPTQGKPV